ncbi:sensor histidine kinase [Micromonospora lupini]|uniref:histidine kinase n=1 Tax=Micromonospora lupini str. Lupac 08 TaxID=1150864 RepID=I0L2S8_9ACTN|nr:histidine kinase [Micromonospora lupini]CCH18125.1 Two-component integral membrane sensor signal transduction histidine kinase [Micromonospora lupini str. Lupac 08]
MAGERRTRRWWARLRLPVGVAAGSATAAVGLGFLTVAAVAFVVSVLAPAASRRVTDLTRRYAGQLVALERRRLAGLLPAGDLPPPTREVDTRRQVGYLAARLLPGTLGLLAYAVLGIGLVLAGIVVRAAVRGELSLLDTLSQVAVGAVLLLLNIQALASIAALDVRLARRLLRPDSRAELTRRVQELTTSRAAVIAAVDAERQRIERDLHDGLQQRLVALGMLLGRARRARDSDRTRALVAQAHEDVQRAVEELREVAWRVYPSALDGSDLGEVLAMVARRSEVPVRIRCDLPQRPERQIETVLYFVACEALTNAAKHAAATLVTVEIDVREGWVRMRVHDDGVGGADLTGRGLSGLARRVAALDGRLGVTSPAGGPTTVLAELPCG